jgi:hypothetical protein
MTKKASGARGAQITVDGFRLDPFELAKLLTPDRGAHYAALGLSPPQISAAEEAVRAVIAGRYGREGP